MQLPEAMRWTLRAGAVILLVAAVVLGQVAWRLDISPLRADELSLVDDPARIELPRPGIWGGEVLVYGAVESAGVRAAELGCRLLTGDGHELSRAKLSHLSQLGSSPVEVQGEELRPLFAVRQPPPGAVLECAGAAAVEPVAVAPGRTFGNAAGIVRAAAAAGAAVSLVLGVVGLVVLRRRR